jgi:hypothetical protein
MKMERQIHGATRDHVHGAHEAAAWKDLCYRVSAKSKASNHHKALAQSVPRIMAMFETPSSHNGATVLLRSDQGIARPSPALCIMQAPKESPSEI